MFCGAASKSCARLGLTTYSSANDIAPTSATASALTSSVRLLAPPITNQITMIAPAPTTAHPNDPPCVSALNTNATAATLNQRAMRARGNFISTAAIARHSAHQLMAAHTNPSEFFSKSLTMRITAALNTASTAPAMTTGMPRRAPPHHANPNKNTNNATHGSVTQSTTCDATKYALSLCIPATIKTFASSPSSTKINGAS